MEEVGGTSPWRVDESDWGCCIWPKNPKKKKKKKKEK
jgi:hypothetical protein